jgi:hypothetical protein
VYNLLKKNFNNKFLKEWFFDIANLLINRTDLIINKKIHKIVEIEIYYNSINHVDPYVHCDILQKSNEKWYFHRINKSYKAGSFKGLDITFGGNNSFGGILIRSIKFDNNIINGPSLFVDYILKNTGCENIEKIDKILTKFDIWDDKAPIYLNFTKENLKSNIIKTPRVGLNLKRAFKNPKMKEFIMKNYRYTNDFRLKKSVAL